MKRWLVCLILICFIGSSSVSQALIVGISKVSSAPAGDCMAGTYLFAWSGEHTSGTDFACDGSATPLDGTVTGSPVFGTDYGEGAPDVGARVDANTEYLSYNSSATIPNVNGAQTVWMRVYVSATVTGDTRLLLFANTTDTIYLNLKSTGTLYGLHDIGATLAAIYSTNTISTGGWIDIAYSWDKPNRDHSINVGSTWKEELDELNATDGSAFTELNILSKGGFSMGVSEYYQMTKFAILNGYQAAKPW